MASNSGQGPQKSQKQQQAGFKKKCNVPTKEKSKVNRLSTGWLRKITLKGGSTLVTLLCNVTPYRNSVNGARDRVTYQKLVTRSRYGLVRCAVGIWLSHERDDTFTTGASVDVQRHAARPHFWYVTRPRAPFTLSRYGVTLRGNVTSVDPP